MAQYTSWLMYKLRIARNCVKELRPGCEDWTTDRVMRWLRNHRNDEDVLRHVHAFEPLADPVSMRERLGAIWGTHQTILAGSIHP
jgi:hypothetical protein